MYAIVDIETTGGNPERDKITEIAVYVFDGTRIVDELVTLVNPERPIPSYITRLTGISDDMVAGAPCFYEIAKTLVEKTDGMIFVAHNAPFDYRFIQSEFKQLGYTFDRKTLCTVKLSRRLIPGKASYSLGNLCAELGISLTDRHRASGDAFATVKLFQLLLSVGNQISPSIFDDDIDTKGLHPSFNPKQIYDLPEETGIYYMYDERGVIIYIGKSINIRKRVLQHFTGAKKRKADEMRSRVVDISYELTGSELIALVKELAEIGEHKPVFNRVGRRNMSRYGIFTSTDKRGYICFNVDKLNGDDDTPLTSFTAKADAVAVMEQALEEFGLCQKLCGLYQSQGGCFHYEIRQCKGACLGIEPSESYNIRAQRALDSFGLGSDSFLLLDKGRSADERSVLKVLHGKVIGYGFFDPTYVSGDMSLIDDCLTTCPDNRAVHQLVKSFKRKAPRGSVVPINGGFQGY